MNTAGCSRGHPLFIEVKALIFGTLEVNFVKKALEAYSFFLRGVFSLQTHLLAEVRRAFLHPDEDRTP